MELVKQFKSLIKGILTKNRFFEKKRQYRKRTLINTKLITKQIDDLIAGNFLDISQDKKTDILISLTSYPARISNVKFTIYSLLRQTILPARIILWLSEEEFPNGRDKLPIELLEFEKYCFEIRFVKENFHSYNKLVFSLTEFPDYAIVTADDDLYYAEDWFEKLVKTHSTYPEDIIAHRIHNMSFTGKELDPYNDWNGPYRESSFLNFLTGCGGVLYPPHSLHHDVTNSNIFVKLSPYADDIWFYAMAILNGRKIRHAIDGYHRLISFDTSLNREAATAQQLQKINVYENGNDVQLRAVLRHYEIFEFFYEHYASHENPVKENT